MSDPSVTVTEAGGLIGASDEVVAMLMAAVPPFAPINGRLSLRQLLGLHVLTDLFFVEAGAAMQIAITASEQADAAKDELLAIAFVRGAPCLGWVRTIRDDLARTVVTLPVNKMMRDLTARISAPGAARERLN